MYDDYRPRRKKPLTGLSVLGAFLATAGLLMLCGGALGINEASNMDTTVESARISIGGYRIGGDRVHNLGLMDAKRTNLTVSIAVAAFGLAFIVIGWKMR